MSTEASVLLAVGCVILGVVGTYGFTFFHESRKEQAARKQLAAILCIELFQQSEHIIHCCTVVNRAFLADPKEMLDEDDIKRYFPPPPVVYLASLDKLGVVKHQVSSDLINFYDQIQRAKDQTVRPQERINDTDEIPVTAVRWIDNEGKPWSVDCDGEIYMHRWATAWQGAAFSAQLLLHSLRAEAGDALNNYRRDSVESEIGILREMWKGKNVTMLPDDRIEGFELVS